MVEKRTTDGPNSPENLIGTGNKRIPARRHDAGSGANETSDGLDANTEQLRHATEDTPTGATPDDAEKTPVFDRGDLPPKI